MSTLLLSGWAQPVDALAPLVDGALLFDYSDYANADDAIAALKKIKPTHVIGWSLGAQLALRAIAAGAISPKHLTLIAAPVRFVSSDPLIKGMDALTYQLFRDSYAKDAARTKTRFAGLMAKGDSHMRRIIEELSHHQNVEKTEHWLPWLEEMAAFSLDVTALASAPPTLIIHGMNDHIVPHAQSEYLVKHLPNAKLSSWAETGHAPHLHDAACLRAEIAEHRAEVMP